MVGRGSIDPALFGGSDDSEPDDIASLKLWAEEVATALAVLATRLCRSEELRLRSDARAMHLANKVADLEDRVASLVDAVRDRRGDGQ